MLYAVVLSPVLLSTLALALQGGALQLERERLRNALDQSVLSAAATLAPGPGTAVDAAQAEETVRQLLADNLRPLEADITGTDADRVAASAEVFVVSSTPATDPLHGDRVLQRPSVVVHIEVPVDSGLLHFAGVSGPIVFQLDGYADLRVRGIGST